MALVLLTAPAESASLCQQLCRCACRQQNAACGGGRLRRAIRSCVGGCRFLNDLCGDACYVGSALLLGDCRDGEVTDYCGTDLDDFGCR